MTTPEKNPPAPTEVDELAREMLELKGKVSTIDENARQEKEPLEKKLGELKKSASGLLREFGSSHAEKSRILHGIAYEIMGTFGTSTSIDAAAVEVFRQALVKAKQARLLKRVFEKTVRWSPVQGWAEIIRGTKLPAKLLALYARCQVTSDRAPTITPREKEKAA
jgi:hypothetical protein